MDLTTKQVALRLKVSGEKVRELIQEYRFPNAYKLDPKKRTSPFFIPEKDVKAFEAQRHLRKP